MNAKSTTNQIFMILKGHLFFKLRIKKNMGYSFKIDFMCYYVNGEFKRFDNLGIKNACRSKKGRCLCKYV